MAIVMALTTDVGLRPLVFDLDGTLIDSRGDIAAAANHALRETGRATQSQEEICRFVGNGAPYLLENVAQVRLTSDDFQVLLSHFQKYYMAHPTDFSMPLPGAQEALEDRERQLALCTSKPRAVTERVIENLGWRQRFQAVVAAGDCEEKKPHPQPLLLVAAQLGVPAQRLIMIGDGPQDILAGKAVGAHTIGVRGGFLDEERLIASEPDVVLDSLLALPAYLSQLDS